jgi:hypothetical protein
MALNAATVGVFGQEWLEKIYQKGRQRWLSQGNAGERFIEINPFISPLAPKLGNIVRPLRVVHMVRDPRDWIQSMGTFKAWGWRKHFIDYVPFAQSIHPAISREWLRMDPIRRLAWRWRLANEQIEACRDACERYELVRYEDLFNTDEETRLIAIKTIVEVLAPDASPDFSKVPWGKVVNPAGGNPIPASHEWSDAVRDDVQKIVGALMVRYGYDGEGTVSEGAFLGHAAAMADAQRSRAG